MRRLAPLAGLIGLLLAIVSPLLLSGGDVVTSLENTSLRTVAALSAIAVVSGLAKAAKLHVLLRGLGERIGFWHTAAISLATDFAFLVSPAGAAGYAANIALLRRAGASWSRATVVVGADQALDLLFFVIAVPITLGLALGPLARVLPGVTGTVYLVLLAVCVLLAIAAWRLRRAMWRFMHRLAARVPWLRRREERFYPFVRDLRQQAATVLRGNWRHTTAVLGFTSVQWLLRYGALWYILVAIDERLPFGFVVLLQAVVMHVGLWTGIPAGGGGADLGLAAALAPWVPPAVMASVLVLWRFATLYFPVVLGLVCLVGLLGSWRAARNFERIVDE